MFHVHPDAGGSKIDFKGAETEERPSGMAGNFNRLVHIYRWMEWAAFGPFLAFCRSTYLQEMRERRRVLIIGDGDGRFTAKLLQSNPEVTVDAVDASRAMILALRRRAGGNAGRLRTQILDARDWQPPLGASYDLIVTHFFLDCLTTAEISDLAARARSAAAPGAIWVLSEFAIPSNWFGLLIAGPIVRALYRVFRLIAGLSVNRLPDYSLALQSAGFLPRSARAQLRGLLISELRQLADKSANYEQVMP
jgi:SAM-dependent methyltransferase